MALTSSEGRVVGSLIEKELTTPQQYPLTLNALVLACNQSSNRDPVVAYSETEVHEALGALKDAGLVRFVHPSHGRSVTRYKHVLDEKLGLDRPRLALLSVLMLRGAQTAGELRGRSERMADFDGIADLEAELDRMSQGDAPYTRRLSRRPGQKEERWVQLFAEMLHPGPGHLWAREATAAGEVPGAAPSQTDISDPSGEVTALRGAVTGLRGDVTALRGDVTALRGDITALRAALARIHEELGMDPMPPAPGS